MKTKPAINPALGTIGLCLLVSLVDGRRVLADDVDISKLPAPVPKQIDFSRDIKPIFEDDCLRCHGPEKPHNHFRLDNRDAALKGGDDGVDILPGKSAQSTLIHYVARLVEDSEMPPVGKGTPLTADQVALLRAWIDQGAKWGEPLTTNALAWSISPITGDTSVSGHSQKFREYYNEKTGPFGGVDDFEFFQQKSPDTRVTASGHALPYDYKIEIAEDRTDLGFIHSGWQQYRKYYDDLGGFDPNLQPSAPSLDENLYLDVGKAWVDVGLTLPDWPKMVLGYEYDYRNGNEGTTAWSDVGSNRSTARNIAPSFTAVNEGVHILKFDLDEDIHGYSLAEQFRGEFYHLSTGYTNVAFGPLPQSVNEKTTYFQGANTFRLEKKINDWLFASAGYLYSKLEGDSAFSMDEPSVFEITTIPQINLERESHVGNVNGMIGPFAGLVVSTGVQAEWTRQDSFGAGNFDQQSAPPPPISNTLTPFNVDSDYDEASLEENVSIHYSKIPFTTLFAEGRFQQENIGQNDQFASAQDILNKAVFYQHTAYSGQLEDFRAGFSTSPWRSAAFSADYRRTDDDSQYDSNPLVQPVQTAYPTFIKMRGILTDAVEAKVVLHPASQFKTTLSYQYATDDYNVDTEPYISFGNVISPGGGLLSGRDHSHTFSINETWVPIPRLYLSGTFSYERSGLTTADAGSPTVAPYQGNIYTAIGSSTYVLSDNTDLNATYSFSDADYGQNNFAAGLPLGIEYTRHTARVGLTRHFGKHISTKLEYRFDYYEEPTSGGSDNYRAHSIFGILAFNFW